jgi:hypothetical protein
MKTDPMSSEWSEHPDGKLWTRVRCAMSGGHVPAHNPLGGFRCSRCGKAAADLEHLGFEDEGYVSEKERRRLASVKEDTGRAR